MQSGVQIGYLWCDSQRIVNVTIHGDASWYTTYDEENAADRLSDIHCDDVRRMQAMVLGETGRSKLNRLRRQPHCRCPKGLKSWPLRFEHCVRVGAEILL